MPTQHECKQCGKTFVKPGTRIYRFCSVTCRNRHLIVNVRWKRDYVRKLKTCPSCGHYGLRAQDLCTRCGYVPPRPAPAIWTPERLTYLREHYTADGAATVAAALGLTQTQVRDKAMKIGLALSRDARQRIIHEAARSHMTRHNPMKRVDVQAKVRAWYDAHPDQAAVIHTKLIAGHQRIQRDKPSKLEARLRTMLTELGVSFEPSALIKDKFIVDIRIGSLIIQADGDYWHGHPRFVPLTPRQLAQQRRDRAQDAYLKTCGYTVVRIWESDMTRDKVAAILREYNLLTIA